MTWDVIEKDPLGKDAKNPGSKLDAGKPRAAILGDFGRALLEVAKVGTYGTNKYSEKGWLVVPNGVKRYSDALYRHLLKESYEDHDEDSELSHAAHVAWNALAVLELTLRAIDKDV